MPNMFWGYPIPCPLHPLLTSAIATVRCIIELRLMLTVSHFQGTHFLLGVLPEGGEPSQPVHNDAQEGEAVRGPVGSSWANAPCDGKCQEVSGPSQRS